MNEDHSSTTAAAPEVLVGPVARRRVRVPTFAIGLVAVALVAGLVGRGLLFGAGGAASPTEAVQQLANALAAEDLAAALTTLAPDEVRDAGDVYASASTKLRNLGVTPETRTLGGVDLSIEGLRLEATPLGPDVARVDILGGRATLVWKLDDMGPAVQDATSGGWGLLGTDELRDGEVAKGTRSGSTSADLADATYRDDGGTERPAFLMAVRREGGWFVSPFYSVAEYVVSLEGATAGDFGEIEEGPAAGTPAAAIDRMIDAVARRDVQAGISSLASGEWAVLRAYRAAIQGAIGDADDGTFTIDDWTTRTEQLDDDTALVSIETISGAAVSHDVSNDQWAAYDDAIEALTASGVRLMDAYDQVPEPTGTEHRLEWRFADGCLVITDTVDPDGSSNSCEPDEDLYGYRASWDVIGLTDGPVGDLREQIEQASIVVVRDRDGWGISPVATLFRALRTVIDRIDEHTIATFTGGELDEEPTVELQPGRTTKVELNSAGFAVVAYRATQGVPFVIGWAGDYFGGTRIRLPNGEEDFAYGPTIPTEGGTYRVLVRGTGTTTPVTIRELPPTGQLPVGPTMPIALDAGLPAVVLTLDVPDGSVLQPMLLDDAEATMTVLGPDGKDVEETFDWESKPEGHALRLEAGRYTVIVALDDMSHDATPFATNLRVFDASSIPTFEDSGDVTTYSWTVPRTPLGPDLGGYDIDRLFLDVPAGSAAVVQFSSYEDVPVGMMWRCSETDPWHDSGDVPDSDVVPGTFRIEAAPAAQSCQLAAVAAEADIDLDLEVAPG